MEILDIVDEYGNPTGKTAEREIVHRRGLFHRTSHCGFCAAVEIRSSFCCKNAVKTRTPFPAVLTYPAPDIYPRDMTLCPPLSGT